jgi:hypothetical protein
MMVRFYAKCCQTSVIFLFLNDYLLLLTLMTKGGVTSFREVFRDRLRRAVVLCVWLAGVFRGAIQILQDVIL